MYFRFKNSYQVLPAIFWLGLTTFALSCEQNLEFDQSSRKNQLMVTAVVGPDSLASIYFAESHNFEGWIEQEKEIVFPLDLAPIIKVGNETYPLSIQTDIFDRPYYRADRLLPDSGTYRLELVFGGDSLYANAKVPPIPITDFDYEFAIVNDPISLDPFEMIRLFFSDYPGSSQAYQIRYEYDAMLEASLYDTLAQSSYLDTIISSRQYQSTSIIDRGRDGEKLYFNIWPIRNVIPQQEDQVNGSSRAYQLIWIVLTAQSPEYYDYALFINQNFRHPLDEPFQEPLLLPSNIQNGFGIFAAYHPSDTVWLKIYLD